MKLGIKRARDELWLFKLVSIAITSYAMKVRKFFGQNCSAFCMMRCIILLFLCLIMIIIAKSNANP